jgi:hypothetical protein
MMPKSVKRFSGNIKRQTVSMMPGILKRLSDKGRA